MQSSGLSSVVPFVSFGCSSRSTLYFHKNFFGKKAVYYFNSIARFPSIPQITSQHKKYSSLKISSCIFSAVRSSSSHGLFLRSVGLMHPQYRFISFHSFVCFPLHFITLQALSFIALHSSRIMSAALRFFSGCSFAQPSGLAPLTSFQL